jgi:peptide/nickel transport system substrate-binding protein
VDLLDRHTVRVRTPEPFADLLDILADGYVVPPGAAERHGADFKSRPVGTGPFTFVEWRPGERLVLERNTHYFMEPPLPQRVEWRLIPESWERIRALRGGHVHIAATIDARDALEASADEAVTIVTARDTTCIVYLFNCFRPPFNDARVRRAVNLAIDKAEIVRSLLQGAGYILSGFVAPGLLGHDPTVEPYAYDPQAARTLLAEAGYGDGLEITIDTPTSSPLEAVELTAMISDHLARVGVVTHAHIVTDRAEYANRVRTKDIHEICCFDSSPLSTYRVLREKISSRTRGSWWEGYENLEVEDLIEMARHTTDATQRAQIYRRCFGLTHRDPPWLFLYNRQVSHGIRTSIGQWRPRADGCVIPQYLT